MKTTSDGEENMVKAYTQSVLYDLSIAQVLVINTYIEYINHPVYPCQRPRFILDETKNCVSCLCQRKKPGSTGVMEQFCAWFQR